MTDIVALDAQRSLPEHVPPELVYDYPLTVANKTTENPFDHIIPELAAGPIAFYARGAVPTGGDAWVFRRAEHPEQIPLATEEFLRAYAAVSTLRICVNETEVAGVRVMPGDRVVMSSTLACRDEKKYENPHEVCLDRGPQHDAFGFGPHRCVGMHLARRELHCALEEFLKAIPQFRIAEGATIVSTLGPMIQPQTLPLVWSAT